MRCPYCTTRVSFVSQTTRPLDEGLEEGDIKRRLRKCRSCQRNFVTFEIHESLFRGLRPAESEAKPAITEVEKPKLERQPLLMESAKPKKERKHKLQRARGVKK